MEWVCRWESGDWLDFWPLVHFVDTRFPWDSTPLFLATFPRLFVPCVHFLHISLLLALPLGYLCDIWLISFVS